MVPSCTVNKKTTFVRTLESACKAVPTANPRAAEALRTILNATLLAARSLDDDTAPALRELESIGAAASATTKRLQRLRKAAPPAERKKADERIHFFKALRHSISSWRFPPPSTAHKARPTLRDVAAQVARVLDQHQAHSLAEDAGVILPTTEDMVDDITREWARYTEAHGDYFLGDSGSQQMVVDAFRAVGFPKRIADKLYDFDARPKKRPHS